MRAAAPARAVAFLVAVVASTVAFRVTLDAVPAAPTNLTAQVVLNSVSLSWTPASGEVLGYRIEAGSASGLRDLASTVIGPVPSFAVSGVPDGRYFVRVRAVGSDGESDPSNEVIVLASSTGCTAVPGAPSGLNASTTGGVVTFAWQSGGGCPTASFTLAVGSAPGVSDLAVANVGPARTFMASAPPGTYYVRVHAQNVFGSSGPSNEVVVAVGSGGCTAAPGAPLGLTATTAGGMVSLAWQSGGGCPATNFTLVVGSAPGGSDLAVASVGTARSLTTSAPPGTYYVRAYAQNAFGSSGPSNEVTVRITAAVSEICRQVTAVLTPAPYGDPDKALMTARYPATASGRAYFDFTSYRRGAGSTWIEYDWWRQEMVLPNGSSSVSPFIDKPITGWRLEFKCDGVLIAAR